MPSLLVKRLLPILILSIFFALSAGLRLASAQKPYNYQNYDATWHVLLTLRALDENPLADHLTLPIVTLGGAENKYYQWATSVPTASGNSLYTSFPPLGFFLPHLLFNLLQLPPSSENLLYFNLFLHLLTTIGIYFLSRAILKLLNAASQELGAILLALSYLFTIETLFSHGVIYWSHALFQPLLIGYLLFLLWLVQLDKVQRWQLGVNLLFCFLLTSIEWTGYLVVLAAGIFLYHRPNAPKRDNLPLMLSSYLGALLSVAYFVLTFLSLIDGVHFLVALLMRFRARDATSSPFGQGLLDLLIGYGLSFGFLLIFLRGFFALRKADYANYALRGIVLISLFAMTENLLLMQHAIVYSFDRLKFFLVLIIGFSLLWKQNRPTRVLVASLCVVNCLLAAIAYGSATYLWTLPESLVSFLDWSIDTRARVWDISTDLAANEQLLADIPSDIALIGMNERVRGYVNLEFGRSIYELITPQDLVDIASKQGKTTWLYLEGVDLGNQIYRYESLIYFDGRQYEWRSTVPNDYANELDCQQIQQVRSCILPSLDLIPQMPLQ